MSLEKNYTDIPGTTIFDADMARRGYPLNQFCMSLMSEANRKKFLADEREYLAAWSMTESQCEAVLERDYNRMLELGGNIYYLAKIIACDGKSFEWAAATMSGMDQQAYREMMLAGGRSPVGNLYEEEANG